MDAMDVLNCIRQQAISHGQSLQPACTAESLSDLRFRAKGELGHEFHDEYAAFLAICNGLDWNGLVVYASERTPIAGYSDRFIEGFLEANRDHREFEPMKDFLVFADSGTVLYTYCISRKQFEVVTSVGLSVLEEFETFDELLRDALQSHA